MAEDTRPFGFWTAAALVVGGVIGAGIFVLPSQLASYGWTGVAAWIFGGMGAMAGNPRLGLASAIMSGLPVSALDRLAHLAEVYVFALDRYRDSANAREFLNGPLPCLMARCRAGGGSRCRCRHCPAWRGRLWWRRMNANDLPK
jgi:hypothetical protein